MEPLAETLQASNIHNHIYAEDTQLYLTISLDDMRSLNSTLQDIENWLTPNHPKLNSLTT